jgi:hypothetical protein
VPYARYANGVKFCKVCHLWIYPADLAKLTYKDARGALRHIECGMMIRSKCKQKHTTRSKTYILKTFILQANPKLVLDKMLKLVLIFAALMATIAIFLPQQQSAFLYASPTTTEEPAAVEETTPASVEEEEEPSSQEEQENEEQAIESQDDPVVPPPAAEEEPPVAGATEPEPPAIVEEEQEPITCPPGQFYVPGDPGGCVDCEGPCPEEPPPTEEGPDEDCLFNPSLPKCASDNGECPDGFNQNEDGNCVPEHPNGCPEGYHSHEDDETGQCIPNDVPCEPGYVIDPDFPTCSKLDSVCERYPATDGCKPHHDNEEHKKTIVINKVIKETHEGKHHDAFPDVDIIGLSVKENGDAIICAMDIDDENIQCQEFVMEDNKVNQDFWRVIETDSDKDYDNGNTGSSDIDDAIEDIKSQDFNELKDADNHDFGIDLAFVAINPQGEGVTCLNTDQSGKGKSLCEPFAVAAEDVDGQITEGVEFDDD